ncbi:hypothetical protein ACFWSF_35190 [Streptomyces sp. NPDC058611]|uniref:hypothetical protein n=1 Tax=unclassified Streptomyces TaxID=2593676 RepID=UPI0036536204
MAELFFRTGAFPLTVDELLAGLPDASPDGRQVYLVSEAGQIPAASAPDLQRDMRFVITARVRSREADLLISTQATVDAEDAVDAMDAFLQVAAWDDQAKVFNFYMRIGPTWVWAGNSWDALEPDSRGKGCFDSHVNGSVVMKELKKPWLNWHSERTDIPVDRKDPLRRNPLYGEVIGAENLERTIEALVQQWTKARLAKVSTSGLIERPHHLLRHLLSTSTVNLASTDIQSSSITRTDDPLVAPMGFWLNRDALIDNLPVNISTAPPSLPADKYVDSLTQFGMHLKEGRFRQPGDAYFAFVVPEASLEDNEVIKQMVSSGLISAKFAACCLMVDFPNPVFSVFREHLMRYVPSTITPRTALENQIVEAILDAATRLPTESPEGQFMAHWQLPDEEWPDIFARRLDAYLNTVATRARTEDGFNDYMRLAESRRRQFRRSKLNEFCLTTPLTNIPLDAPLLAMREDGTVTELVSPNH